MKEITASTDQFLFTLEQMYLAGVEDENKSTEDEVLTPEDLRERIINHLTKITTTLESINVGTEETTLPAE